MKFACANKAKLLIKKLHSVEATTVSYLKVKVKFSHTHYRALGPELIPMYRQSARRWLSHPPGCRLPLLSARPAVTFPAEERHRPSASTKLYCLVTEAHSWQQLAQESGLAFWIANERSTVTPQWPQLSNDNKCCWVLTASKQTAVDEVCIQPVYPTPRYTAHHNQTWACLAENLA